MTDAVPAPIRDLAALFADALTDVKFPDVDAAALGAAVSRVDALAQDVVRLEEQLAEAQKALEGGAAELVRLATRAHAYARVFADDNDELRARVDAIALPRPRAPRGSASAAASSSSSSSSAPSSSAGLSPASPSSSSSPPDGDAGTNATPRRRKKGAGDDAAQLFGGAPPTAAAAE